MSDLDATDRSSRFGCAAFCRGYTTPLAMMGVALNRCLPGHNAMLANESYVILYFVPISKYRATNIDLDALVGGCEKPIHTIFVSVGQAQDTLIC